jgi:EpsI family protein
MPINISAAPAPTPRRGTDLGIAGLIAAAIAAYWPTSRALWDYWTDWLFGGHGVFVAALALWLLWRAKDRIAQAPPQSQPWVVVPLVLCSVAALIFWRAGIQSLQLLLWPLLIVLAVLAAFGRAVTRVIAVPVCFLYFAMPAWNLLAEPLQRLTIWAVKLFAPAIGVPATISGNLIYLPGDTRFSVELACSGVGFFVEGLAVAALLGELEQASIRRRLTLLASMVLVALVTNWIRVLTIVQVGYATQMRHVLVTRYHVLFGYVLFVTVLVVFVWLATRRELPAAAPSAPAAIAPPAPWSYLRAVLALAAAPLAIALLALSSASHEAVYTLHLPSGQADWGGPLDTADVSWRPVFIGPHQERRGTYKDTAGRTVEALAIGYESQAPGHELVAQGNSLLGNGGLTRLRGELVEGDGRYREELVVDEHGLRSLIWSFYDIGGHSFVAPRLAQLWYGVHALGAPPYSVLFAFRAACAPSCDEARRTLRDFAHAMRPQLLASQNSQARSLLRPGAGAGPQRNADFRATTVLAGCQVPAAPCGAPSDLALDRVAGARSSGAGFAAASKPGFDPRGRAQHPGRQQNGEAGIVNRVASATHVGQIDVRGEEPDQVGAGFVQTLPVCKAQPPRDTAKRGQRHGDEKQQRDEIEGGHGGVQLVAEPKRRVRHEAQMPAHAEGERDTEVTAV